VDPVHRPNLQINSRWNALPSRTVPVEIPSRGRAAADQDRCYRSVSGVISQFLKEPRRTEDHIDMLPWRVPLEWP